MVVPNIKKEYGSQKDFTQVWNSTMAGVRWAEGDLGVGRNKQGPSDHLLFISSLSAVASPTTQILRGHPM